MANNNVGHVTQILGAVVDVKFDGDLPAILSALEIDHNGKRLTQSGVILTYLSEKTGLYHAKTEDDRLEVLQKRYPHEPYRLLLGVLREQLTQAVGEVREESSSLRGASPDTSAFSAVSLSP